MVFCISKSTCCICQNDFTAENVLKCSICKEGVVCLKCQKGLHLHNDDNRCPICRNETGDFIYIEPSLKTQIRQNRDCCYKIIDCFFDRFFKNINDCCTNCGINSCLLFAILIVVTLIAGIVFSNVIGLGPGKMSFLGIFLIGALFMTFLFVICALVNICFRCFQEKRRTKIYPQENV